MDKRRVGRPTLVGGSSLLAIFAVLCLTIFALLSLSTVLAEDRLREAAAQGVSDYYEGEYQAQVLFARLRAGERPEEVREENGSFCYTCPISETQDLEVELACQEGTWTVLRWQAVSTAVVPDDSPLTVWDGGGEHEKEVSAWN